MRLQLTKPLVCLDLETTGLDPQSDRIVEIGLVKLWPDGRRESIQRQMDPGIDIPESSTRIHGIRNDDVRGLFGQPPLPKLADELLGFLEGADLTGFNVGAPLGDGTFNGYDLPLWLAEVERHGLAFSMEGREVVDARILFLAKEPSWDRFVQGPRNLNNAVLHYCGRDLAESFAQRDDGGESSGQTLDEMNRHSAEKDADATLDVLIAQVERYEDLPADFLALAKFCADFAQNQATAAR